MLSCQEVTRLVSESFDRPLPLGVSLSVRLHVFFIRQTLRRGAGHLDDHDLPVLPVLPLDARERIKQSLAREA
jgi:hypothetical protein